MPDPTPRRTDVDRINDTKLLTPLLLMALLIVCGFLYFAYTGQTA
jgi:hypothetical protein